MFLEVLEPFLEAVVFDVDGEPLAVRQQLDVKRPALEARVVKQVLDVSQCLLDGEVVPRIWTDFPGS